jgi:hypothetical protein
MITSHLQGGLGNQMFQIAASYALSKRLGVDYGFNFDLCDTPNQGHTSNNYKLNLFKKINNYNLDLSKFIRYTEPKFSYSELPKIDNLCLYGYFQSEKYFKDYEKDIRELFNIDIELKNKIKDFITSLNNKKSTTSIHVRRGDYLKFSNYHKLCPISFFKESMKIIGDSNFIVVSDDLNWCKENFLEDNVFFSPFNSEIDDFILMSLCENNIISNSSFSWWASYLNNNESKKIIAPNFWFGEEGPKDTFDIYKKEWIIL